MDNLFLDEFPDLVSNCWWPQLRRWIVERLILSRLSYYLAEVIVVGHETQIIRVWKLRSLWVADATPGEWRGNNSVAAWWLVAKTRCWNEPWWMIVHCVCSLYFLQTMIILFPSPLFPLCKTPSRFISPPSALFSLVPPPSWCIGNALTSLGTSLGVARVHRVHLAAAWLAGCWGWASSFIC